MQERVLVNPKEAIPLIAILCTVLGFMELLIVNIILYAATLLVNITELLCNLLGIVHVAFMALQALADVAEATNASIDVQHVFQLSDLLVTYLR